MMPHSFPYTTGSRLSIPCVLLCLAGCLVHTGPCTADLEREIRDIVRASTLRDATIGISVLDTGTPGKPRVGINHSRALKPASNIKLLVTGTAMLDLPEDVFTTRATLTQHRLWIVGSGDPSLGDPDRYPADNRDGDPDALLEQVVEAVRRARIDALEEVMIDDRVLDRTWYHPTWPRDQSSHAYRAQVGGVNFHTNTLSLDLVPHPGTRPSWSITPRVTLPGFLSITNDATGRTGKNVSTTVGFSRYPNENRYRISGNCTHPFRDLRTTIHAPPLFFGELLSDRLRAAGISVNRVRLVAEDAPPPAGRHIWSCQSSLGPIIARCNTQSQNMYAEALLKRIGHQATGRPGTCEDGSARIRWHLLNRGLEQEFMDDIVIADGSGLSHDNRFSPGAFTAWLASMARDERVGSRFISSLARGGKDGTLSRRLGDITPSSAVIRAKSGYINGVSCLSGYVLLGDLRWCFSIMINNMTVPNLQAKRLQDRIVQAIVDEVHAMEHAHAGTGLPVAALVPGKESPRYTDTSSSRIPRAGVPGADLVPVILLQGPPVPVAVAAGPSSPPVTRYWWLLLCAGGVLLLLPRAT